MKDSFILYTEQKAIIDKLTDEQAGKLIKAIYEYVATDKMPELETTIDLVITPFKIALDKNKEKYQNVVVRNRENGMKGGRPKKPTGFFGNPTKPKKADNDKEYYNDTIQKYNKLIKTFPISIVSLFKRKKEKLFFDQKSMNDSDYSEFKY